ncbi:MAG: dephospho-CoA kinase [Alphaproteobacteria bacterium]
MIVIGLTGSIGMGKSTAAAMLETLKIPVHSADDAVHELLAPGGGAALAVGAAFPYFEFPKIYGRKTKSGARAIKRKEFGEIIFKNDKLRKKLENILHPLVQDEQNKFIRSGKNKGLDIIALDIPLLFEAGREEAVDYIIVVTAPYEIQRTRVLARPGMDEDKFQAILKRQMPDGEKCARADYVIHTGLGRAQTMKELKSALADIRKKNK